MLKVGVPAAEADLGLKDFSSCSGAEQCFKVGDPPRAAVGIHAGTIYGESGPNGPGGHSGCWVFLYEDAGGWHYVNARCAQATGYIPGAMDRVFVTGCANVRSDPGLSSQVLDCVKGGTIVDVDSAPVYVDGHIWWHLSGRGWMAHDFLLAPKGTP
jgi:hypothetical protein